MTAFATKLTSATFSTALKGLRLPSRRKLVGEYVLGGSQAESIKNRANPSLPLTVQGVPTYNANSVIVRSSTSAGFGFKTGIILNDDATLIVVRKNAGAQPVVVGATLAGGALFGMADFGTNAFGHNGEAAIGLGANRAMPGAGTISFEALVCSVQNPQLVTGGLGLLYYYSGGVQQLATSATQNSNPGRGTLTQICIGSDSLTDSITTNNLEVYFVAIYQRSLTTAEIDAAYAAVVAYYAALGVTVV